LKEAYFDGLAKKKQCIRVLLEKSSSEHRKKFNHWATFMRTFRQINACRRTADLFFTLQLTFQSNVAPLLVGDKESELKEKTILRLLHN
jgi:hypothetical protein